MTEQTKEQVWKKEARKAYQGQQSQDNEGGCREPIGFVQGYIAAKKSDFDEIKTLKERLTEFVKLAKLGVYSVEGLLTHNHESWELSTESWLLKTKTLIEKQDKENKYDLENMSCFTVSRHPVPMRDRTLKIIISYEIDREITIKESDLENAFKDINIAGHSMIELGVMDRVKKKLFGGGENE